MLSEKGNNLWPNATDKINRARRKIEAQYGKMRLTVQKNPKTTSIQ